MSVIERNVHYFLVYTCPCMLARDGDGRSFLYHLTNNLYIHA